MGKVVAKPKTERELQRLCLKWFKAHLIYKRRIITHLNPSAKAKSEAEGHRLAASRGADGVQIHLPDLWVFAPDFNLRFGGLGIEMKLPETSLFHWMPRTKSIFDEKGCYLYQADNKDGRHIRAQIRMARRMLEENNLSTFAWDLDGFQQICNFYLGSHPNPFANYTFMLKCRYTGQPDEVTLPILTKYIP